MRKIRKFFKVNENKANISQLMRLHKNYEEILKCVFENIDIKREERSQIKNLTFHHNKLGSDEQTTLRASRKKGNKVESRNN